MRGLIEGQIEKTRTARIITGHNSPPSNKRLLNVDGDDRRLNQAIGECRSHAALTARKLVAAPDARPRRRRTTAPPPTQPAAPVFSYTFAPAQLQAASNRRDGPNRGAAGSNKWRQLAESDGDDDYNDIAGRKTCWLQVGGAEDGCGGAGQSAPQQAATAEIGTTTITCRSNSNSGESTFFASTLECSPLAVTLLAAAPS